MNTGACQFGDRCKFSHGKTVSANAVEANAESIVQQLGTMWQEGVHDMQQQQHQMMDNMSPGMGANHQHNVECNYANNKCPWTVGLNGGVVAKVAKRDKGERAHSAFGGGHTEEEDEWITTGESTPRWCYSYYRWGCR